MSEAGEIVMPNGAALGFADDGGAIVTTPGQRPQRGPAQLAGYTPEARRTAALLALIVATTGLAREQAAHP
jgi:hypothetical protein